MGLENTPSLIKVSWLWSWKLECKCMLWIISGQKNFTGRPFHLVKPKPPLKYINKKLLVLFYTCNMQVRFDLVVLNDSKGIVVEWTSKYVIKSFWKVYALSASNIKRLAAVSHCFSNLSHTVRKQGAVNPSLRFKQVLLAVCNLTQYIFANMGFSAALMPLACLSFLCRLLQFYLHRAKVLHKVTCSNSRQGTQDSF